MPLVLVPVVPAVPVLSGVVAEFGVVVVLDEPVAPVVLPTPVVSVWLETPGVLLAPVSGVVDVEFGVVLVEPAAPVVVLGVPCVTPVEPVLPLVVVLVPVVSVVAGVVDCVPDVPAVFPVIELLLPVPDAPVVVCVAVTPWFSPTGAVLVEFTLPWSDVLPLPTLDPEPLLYPPALPEAPVELVELAPVAAPVPEPVPEPLCALATPRQSSKAVVIPNVRITRFLPHLACLISRSAASCLRCDGLPGPPDASKSRAAGREQVTPVCDPKHPHRGTR